MNPILKNILAVVGGWLGGSIVNSGLVQLGLKLMPIEGLDPESLDSYAAIFPTLSAKYFIFPFLAHALGTFIGALTAARIAVPNNKMTMAYVVGGIFLLGGIAANYLIPGPMWFTVADLVLAYIPMAWIGGSMGAKIGSRRVVDSGLIDD